LFDPIEESLLVTAIKGGYGAKVDVPRLLNEDASAPKADLRGRKQTSVIAPHVGGLEVGILTAAAHL
jgi:hypothetical protein